MDDCNLCYIKKTLKKTLGNFGEFLRYFQFLWITSQKAQESWHNKKTKHRSPDLVGVQDNTRFLWFGYMSNQRPATKAWSPSEFGNAWLQKNLSAKSWKLPPNGCYRIFWQSPSTPALQMLLICPMMDSITNLSFWHWICLIWIMLEIYEAVPSDHAPSNIYSYPSFILFYLADFFELWESGWLTELQSHSYN